MESDFNPDFNSLILNHQKTYYKKYYLVKPTLDLCTLALLKKDIKKNGRSF